MRTDFTSGFNAEKNKTSNEPVNVLRLVWPVVTGNPALTIYLTDRLTAVGAFACVPIVAAWAEIDHLMSDEADEAVGDTQVRVVNAPVDFGSGAERFSDLVARYPLEAATATLYQWFGGASLSELDLSALFEASCEPVEWDERSFTFDLIQISRSYGDQAVGRKITRNEYPNAPDSSLGKRIPIPIGTVPGVPAIPVREAPRTEIRSFAQPGDTTLDVRDTSKFPAAGELVIGEDVIKYTGKTADQLTGCSGVRSFHYADEEVLQNVKDYRLVVSDKYKPVDSYGTIRTGADPVTTGVLRDVANGEVVFSSPPRKKVGVNTQFLRAFFDVAATGNTALDPELAIDKTKTTEHARININNRKLAVRQTDEIGSLGDIGKVELQINHWAEEKYATDQVQVRVNGNIVGNLNRPSQDDKAVVAGSADEVVPIIHSLGYPIDVPQPGISASTDANRTEEQSGSGATSGQRLRTGTLVDPQAVASIPVSFPAVPGGVSKAVYTVQITCYEETVNFGTPTVQLGSNGVAIRNVSSFPGGPITWSYITQFTVNGGSHPTSMNFTLAGGSASTKIDIGTVKRTLYFGASVSASQGAQNTFQTGGIDPANVNAPLAVVTEKSTMSTPDLFDITSIIGGNWANLKNLLVEIEYIGSTDLRTVNIVLVELFIEHHVSRYQLTDDVYVDVVGVVDSDGAVTGVPGTVIETVPDLFEWSILVLAGLSSSKIDSASFTAAGTKFANAIAGGYKMAGIIFGEETLDELWAQWAFETRSYFFFDALGKARLQFRSLNNSSAVEGEEVKTIQQSMIRREQDGGDKIRFRRTLRDDVVNDITVKYARNYFTDEFSADVTLTDQVSIDLYKRREKPPARPFDLYFNRQAAQAQNVGEFWLALLKQPSTLVEFEVFLDNMELERGDAIKFNHALGALADIYAEVLPGKHVLGSGRDRVMDHVLLNIRLFPVAFLQDLFSESIEVSDDIAFVTAFLLDLVDDVETAEKILMSETISFSENIETTDSFSHLIAVLLAENLDVSESILIADGLLLEEPVSISELVLVSDDDTGYGDQGYGDSPYGGAEPA